MLNLPDVTLVMVDKLCHRLAKMALDESLSKAAFGDVIVCSDNFDILYARGARHIALPRWDTKLEWCQFLWRRIPPLVDTSHVLVVQWDSWILDPACWDDAFLTYDYVGAPWGQEVGNSGFCLRSKRLMDFLLDHAEEFPCADEREDSLLCRGYRPRLEKHGFRWPARELALRFSYERDDPPPGGSFGFHGTFNWPRIFDRDAMAERFRLMRDNPYVRDEPSMLPELYRKEPWLKELT